jgi:hypothetical protein
MRVHIVGAGPTGMSIAWELVHFTEHEVVVYDSKSSAGGSWWEPSVETRDLHAHRAVFKNAFVNTNSIFKEMGIQWDDIFTKEKGSVYGTMFKSLGPRDYWALTSLSARVLSRPEKYKKMSLKEALGPLTKKGQRFVETITYSIDGVGWDTMSAYELVQSFNHVGMSTPETQKVSGKVMSDAMQEALIAKGVTFVFDTSLKDVDYRDDGFTATFSGDLTVNDGLLVLCVDHNAAPKLIKDNWGPVHDTLESTAYECINVLMDYDEPLDVTNTLEIGMQSEWTVLAELLDGGKTLSCVLCNLTEEILTMKPEELKIRVLEQVGGKRPSGIRIGWGADWDGIRWRFSQSAGVLSTQGQIPFYGGCHHVAMCGLMSERHTPYASIEAATEVGRMFCHGTFGTRPPLRPVLVTDVLMLLIVFSLLILIQR